MPMNKRVWKLAAVTAVLLLSGCGGALDYRNAEISNNLIFEKGANTPFSGTVTGVPAGAIPFPNPNNMLVRIGEYVGDFSWGQLTTNSGPAKELQAICTVHAKEGRLNGKASCVLPNSGEIFATFEYRDFNPTGNVEIFSGAHPGNPFVKFHLNDDGALDGTLRIYYTDTGALAVEQNVKNGRKHGEQASFHKVTGRKISVSNYLGDVANGDSIIYGPDGETVLSRKTYKDGVLQGRVLIAARDGTVLVDGVFRDGHNIDNPRRAGELAERLIARGGEGDIAAVKASYLTALNCLDETREKHSGLAPWQWNSICKYSAPEDIYVSGSDIAAPAPEGHADIQQVVTSVPVAVIQQSLSSGPSFDCTKAATPVERLICSSPHVSSQDSELMKAYRTAGACAPDKATLVEGQRGWVAERNDCSTEQCLAEAYRSRIQVLISHCR